MSRKAKKRMCICLVLLIVGVYFFLMLATSLARASVSPEIALASFPAKKIINVSVDLFAEAQEGDFCTQKIFKENDQEIIVVVFFKTIRINIPPEKILDVEVYAQKIAYGDSVPADSYKIEGAGINFEVPACLGEIFPEVAELDTVNLDKYFIEKKGTIIIPIGATIDSVPLEFYRGKVKVIIFLR